MSYEPRGKTKELLDAMRVDGAPVAWPSCDVAKAMGIAQSAVSAYTDAAIKNGALFRLIENGRALYSLKALPSAATGSTPPTATEPRPGSRPAWNPPVMVPPRGEASSPSAPAPSPSAPAPDPVIEGDVEQAEGIEFDANLWLDGTLVIYGAQENEDGSISLSATQFAAIRRRFAWSAP